MDKFAEKILLDLYSYFRYYVHYALYSLLLGIWALSTLPGGWKQDTKFLMLDAGYRTWLHEEYRNRSLGCIRTVPILSGKFSPLYMTVFMDYFSLFWRIFHDFCLLPLLSEQRATQEFVNFEVHNWYIREFFFAPVHECTLSHTSAPKNKTWRIRGNRCLIFML